MTRLRLSYSLSTQWPLLDGDDRGPYTLSVIDGADLRLLRSLWSDLAAIERPEDARPWPFAEYPEPEVVEARRAVRAEFWLAEGTAPRRLQGPRLADHEAPRSDENPRLDLLLLDLARVIEQYRLRTWEELASNVQKTEGGGRKGRERRVAKYVARWTQLPDLMRKFKDEHPDSPFKAAIAHLARCLKVSARSIERHSDALADEFWPDRQRGNRRRS